MAITYEWRGDFEDPEVNLLHAEGFGHPALDIGWREQVRRHSLGWVCARDGAGAGELAGFVNVAWDGGVHAFVLDTVVAGRRRGQGIGAALVARAAEGARDARCEWLHVDFDDELRGFYFDACGFRSTAAGLIAL
ncbi:GNAT family N-acetyltransferase [Streptomyces formicae]|uniref:Histone acetyltransferase HPA2-related acetyltransferase n=1 Tax=Streptomyces formicae TaxID=1616117 RepID=A0A291QE92_9ACTN|nr:GNAT family N-acetyltransferase [Streptomyces formicae]ATL30031.1 Histone acetyltransferase HPA2-related acetyltransferase [Streptomyces formicae]